MTRVCRALGALLLIAAAAPATALGNGDPASDVLITDTVFLPYQAPTEETTTKLRRVVEAAREAGQPVRVAVIESPQDLGAVSNLYGHPREYARLLSQELGNPVEPGAKGHREELIVVMPAGYGTANVPAEVDRRLRSLELASDAGSDDLAAAAGYGVQELAAANGRRIPPTFGKPETEGGSGALTAVLVIGALVLLVAFLIVLRVRAGKGAAQSPGGNT